MKAPIVAENSFSQSLTVWPSVDPHDDGEYFPPCRYKDSLKVTVDEDGWCNVWNSAQDYRDGYVSSLVFRVEMTQVDDEDLPDI